VKLATLHVVSALVALTLPLACTDSRESQESGDAGGFFRTEAEVVSGVAGVYNLLRTTARSGLLQHERDQHDEMIVRSRQ